MSRFLPALVQAVKEERFRILYGGHSPNAQIWIAACQDLYNYIRNGYAP